MEGCQGCGTGTDAVDVAADLVDAAIHFVHAVTDIVNRPVERPLLMASLALCVTDVMDDVAAHVDAAILDGNIFRRIGIETPSGRC